MLKALSLHRYIFFFLRGLKMITHLFACIYVCIGRGKPHCQVMENLRTLTSANKAL